MPHLTRRAIQGDWLPPSPPACAEVSADGWLRRGAPPKLGSRKRDERRRVPVPFLQFLLLTLSLATDAEAQFNGALRGEYDVSLHRTCWANLTARPAADMAMQGRLSFSGPDGVSLTAEALEPAGTGGPTPLYTKTDLSNCTGTYSVNAAGTFTATFPTCNITITIVDSPLFTPQVVTGTLANLKLRGKLAHDGTVLVLGSTATGSTDVETQNCASSPPCAATVIDRLCTTDGLATSRR